MFTYPRKEEIKQKKEPPKYLWSPENEPNVIKRGEVVEVEIINGIVKSVRKFSELK